MSIESLYCLWCLLRVFPGEFLLGGSRRRNRRLSATVVDPTDYGAPGCLAGTAGAKPRCTALEGVIGGQVHCRIYAQRPSVCRDFTMAWENGEANQQCDKARAAWGLPPLSPPQPLKPDHHPHQSPAPKAA